MFYATGYHYNPAAGKFPSVVRQTMIVRKAVNKLKRNVEMHHMRELSRQQRAPGASAGEASAAADEDEEPRSPPRTPSPCLCPAMDLDGDAAEDDDDVVVVSVGEYAPLRRLRGRRRVAHALRRALRRLLSLPALRARA